MTRDESGSTGGQNLTARDVEGLPIEEITKELDRRGVAYKAPPRLMASIAAFREKEAKTLPRELTEADKREIARIERTPIEIIRAELDRLGVNHRARLDALRRLIRGGVKTPFWGRESCSLMQIAAMIAVVVGCVWLVQVDDSSSDRPQEAGVVGRHENGPAHVCRINEHMTLDQTVGFNSPAAGLAAVETREDVDGVAFSLPAYKQAGDPERKECDAMAEVNLGFGLPVTPPPGCASK
jgi:hypothetical protein